MLPLDWVLDLGERCLTIQNRVERRAGKEVRKVGVERVRRSLW